MTGLSEPKRRSMKVLFSHAPEEVLEAIEARFHNGGSGLAGEVAAMARHERLERAALRLAFGPFLALFSTRDDGIDAPQFPRATLNRLWAQVGRRCPEPVKTLRNMVHIDPSATVPASLTNGLCAEAASILRNEPHASLALASEAQARELAAYFDTVSVAGPAVELLPEWLRRMDNDQLAVLRLMFKDADGLREDGRVRLMEILMAQLPRAAEVLRLIAALTDQAHADFIDASEMAVFPARLIEFAEAQAAAVALDARSMDADRAEACSGRLNRIAEVLKEFDVGFPGATGGSWTRRLVAVRQRLTSQLEQAYRAMPQAVEKALPMASKRLAGRMSRMGPDLDADASAPAVGQASAMLQLLAGTRSIAADLGCEGARRTAADAIAERVDAYAEEALRMLHDQASVDEARALALIEVAAEFLSLSRNAEAGSLVRRRAAVASSLDLDRDPEAA